MSRRRRRAPLWPRIAAVAAAVLLAALAVALLARLITGAMGLLKGGSAGEADPQFAPPAETVTRPPDPEEAVTPEALAEDPSLGWVYEAESPVDKTAEELSREAAAAP